MGTEAGEEEVFFPVMGWDQVNNPALLEAMRECGINIGGFGRIEQLDDFAAADLKVIVSDPRGRGYDWENVDVDEAREKVESLVRDLEGHPAVYAINLRDEPTSLYFEGLAKVGDLIREMAPDIPPFVNLFPNYASPQQLGEPTYAEHVEKFVEIFRPEILSYDHYALFEDGSLREDYWSNLELIREVALRNDIPFWNVILSSAHFNFREVTAADLRFQVFTTLAYGGKGIVYFKYLAPARGNYRMAPVDQFGNKTRTWEDMRNVNNQIHKLAPVLLKLTSDAVYHFGEVPRGSQGPPEDSLVVEADPNFMVGDFTHTDGTRYVMLVNRDFNNSHVCVPKFRTPPEKVELISAFTGRPTGFIGEQVWFAPGQGMLLRLE